MSDVSEDGRTPPLAVTVQQSRVQWFLIDVIAIVATAGLAVEIAQDSFGWNDPYDLIDLFSLSYEANIPTWLSACMHATSAVLLTLIANGKRDSGAPFVRHWRGLSIVFAYISIDEFVTLHEGMNAWFDLDGVLYFGWVIPAAIIVSIFVLSYWQFLTHLPDVTRFRFIRAGAVFVGGAMGIELLLGYWTDLHGSHNLGYAIIDWVEETMEMTGAALFISALVAVLADQSGQIRLVPGPPPSVEDAAADADPTAVSDTPSSPDGSAGSLLS